MTNGPHTIEAARAAKAKLSARIGGRAGVQGIGITQSDSGFAVKVNLATKASGQKLPRVIAGVPVISEVVGKITKRRAG